MTASARHVISTSFAVGNNVRGTACAEMPRPLIVRKLAPAYKLPRTRRHGFKRLPLHDDHPVKRSSDALAARLGKAQPAIGALMDSDFTAQVQVRDCRP